MYFFALCPGPDGPFLLLFLLLLFVVFCAPCVAMLVIIRWSRARWRRPSSGLSSCVDAGSILGL
jgi:hypothetical protein